jgi:hypothetical protein
MPRKRKAIPVDELTWSQLAQNYPELLRPNLEAWLIKRVRVDELSREITQILKTLGKKPGTPETVARNIATVLAPHFRHVSTSLDRLIENRPAELAAALDRSVNDECRRLAEALSRFPQPKKIRAKQPTEEQKRRNVQTSKNRYERRRRRFYPRPEIGRIELEFGTRPADFSLLGCNAAPTGPCLDTLLKFGEVSMSQGANSLEQLFGVDRHELPKSLPSVQRGRRVFYNIRALLVCIKVRLENGRWLADTDRRALVLSGIIKRAQDVGEPELATILEKFFGPYLA